MTWINPTDLPNSMHLSQQRNYLWYLSRGRKITVSSLTVQIVLWKFYLGFKHTVLKEHEFYLLQIKYFLSFFSRQGFSV